MSRKTSSIFLSASIILITLSFISGIFYERWQKSKNTLDIDPSLVVLLTRPSDFEMLGGKLVTIGFTQSYYDPTFTSIDDYKGASYSFNAYFQETDVYLGVSHDIRRYVPDKIPTATHMDAFYQGATSTSDMEIHWLDLEELDSKSRAFCTSSKHSSTINCYVESSYVELISTFSIWASNMEEIEIINFLIPAIQKFYERLSESSIKYSEENQ